MWQKSWRGGAQIGRGDDLLKNSQRNIRTWVFNSWSIHSSKTRSTPGYGRGMTPYPHPSWLPPWFVILMNCLVFEVKFKLIDFLLSRKGFRLEKWNFQGWFYRLKYVPRRYFKYSPLPLFPLEGSEICVHDRSIPIEILTKQHFTLIYIY